MLFLKTHVRQLLINDTRSGAEIARLIGCSRSLICQLRKRNLLPAGTTLESLMELYNVNITVA